MSERRVRDVYAAIMVAAARGTGLHLTWDECWDLATDNAIETRASNALDEATWKATVCVGDWPSGWKGVDPARVAKMRAANRST